jgi:DNA gyrase subunit A
VAIFTNLGKLYVIRAMDVPATTGFGEPLGNLLTLGDGESVVGLIAPDPAMTDSTGEAAGNSEEQISAKQDDHTGQQSLFDEFLQPAVPVQEPNSMRPSKGVLITRRGKGFRFDYEVLREPSKRAGRKMVHLREGDETVAVKPEDGSLVVVASDAGKALLFPMEQVPVLTVPVQGVRMIILKSGCNVVGLEVVNENHELEFKPKKGKDKTVAVTDMPNAKRGGMGKTYCSGIVSMERGDTREGPIQ